MHPSLTLGMFNMPEVPPATGPDQHHLFLPTNQASRPSKNRNFCEEANYSDSNRIPGRPQKEITNSKGKYHYK